MKGRGRESQQAIQFANIMRYRLEEGKTKEPERTKKRLLSMRMKLVCKIRESEIFKE